MNGAAVRWILIILGLAAAVFVAYLIVRAAVLLNRSGGFHAWLWCPNEPRWRRGRAFYGQKKMAWYAEASMSPRPACVFNRTDMDVIQLEGPDVNTGLIVIVFDVPERRYKLAVAPAVASGIVSWVGSSPPGL